MIGQVITHLNGILQGMPFFKTVYGICELKTNSSQSNISQPVYFDGFEWQQVQLSDYGYTYWRKNGDASGSEVDGLLSCTTEYENVYPLKLIAMTTRSQFPMDDAYSPDRLAATITKGITITGGDLKREINARALSIRVDSYSVNTEEIIDSELNNVSFSDYSHCDLIISMDVSVTIRQTTNCIVDACDYQPQFCLALENYVAINN